MKRKKILIAVAVMLVTATFLGSFSANAWQKMCDGCAADNPDLVGTGKCGDCQGTGLRLCNEPECELGERECEACRGEGKTVCAECGGLNPECEACEGTGFSDCAVCNKTGHVKCDKCTECETCNGTGKCAVCQGTGTVEMGEWTNTSAEQYPQYVNKYGKTTPETVQTETTPPETTPHEVTPQDTVQILPENNTSVSNPENAYGNDFHVSEKAPSAPEKTVISRETVIITVLCAVALLVIICFMVMNVIKNKKFLKKY